MSKTTRPSGTLVRAVLERDGFVVSAAADGAEALRLLAEDLPDLVISDWQLPRIHGRHVVAASRELAPALPIIVLSGDTGRARAEFDPADPHLYVLMKPFGLGRLRALARPATRPRDVERACASHPTISGTVASPRSQEPG